MSKPRGKIKTKAKRGKLIKEADKAYSTYVRLKYADKDGMVKCYTCDDVYHYKKLQCGHYISRLFKYTRWDLNNLRPQCFYCNMRRAGCAFIFRQNLVDEIGEDIVKAMEKKARELFIEKDEWIQAKLDELPKTVSS